jgi:hypothetical protein
MAYFFKNKNKNNSTYILEWLIFFTRISKGRFFLDQSTFDPEKNPNHSLFYTSKLFWSEFLTRIKFAGPNF